ncbi:MAG: lysophospholipid acyltransferase family protein [Clostridia bacterium]
MLLMRLVRTVLLVLFPVRARGVDAVPDSPVILACNHMSLMDPLIVVCTLRRKVFFMAKKELFVPPLGAILRALGAFPVERGATDLPAVRRSIQVLREGKTFGIFPQGKRTFKGGAAFLSGVALIAAQSRVPVVPVYIDRRARLFRPVFIAFGAPVDLSEMLKKPNSAALKTATGTIEQAVYALAPAQNEC